MLSAYTLLTELSKCADDGWLPYFLNASKSSAWPLGILLAIASRESNCRHIIGDQGNGVGIMQIDVRTDPSVLDYWQDKEKYMNHAVGILSGKKATILAKAGKEISMTDSKGNHVKFTVPFLIPEPMLTRITIAAYNAGMWPVYQFTKGRDPDRSTTCGDYSNDVLARAGIFEIWIERIKKIADQLKT